MSSVPPVGFDSLADLALVCDEQLREQEVSRDDRGFSVPQVLAQRPNATQYTFGHFGDSILATGRRIYLAPRQQETSLIGVRSGVLQVAARAQDPTPHTFGCIRGSAVIPGKTVYLS